MEKVNKLQDRTSEIRLIKFINDRGDKNNAIHESGQWG